MALENSSPGRSLKLTVVGDGTVGKTCLLISYTTKEFPEEYIPTVFDNYAGEEVVNGTKYAMNLWDTAGQEEYERLRPLSYPNTSCFIVCFALDNRHSFDNVSMKWLPEVKRHCPKAPIILVGTKKDLNKKVTSVKDAKKLCKKENLAAYLECSAKTREGIDAVFTEAIISAAGLRKKETKCSVM